MEKGKKEKPNLRHNFYLQGVPIFPYTFQPRSRSFAPPHHFPLTPQFTLDYISNMTSFSMLLPSNLINHTQHNKNFFHPLTPFLNLVFPPVFISFIIRKRRKKKNQHWKKGLGLISIFRLKPTSHCQKRE